ncbi:exosporium leader peptide-containing protein [Bacillus mycoides]
MQQLDPSLISPTLPPIPSFTLPTGATGATGTAITSVFCSVTILLKLV